MEPQVTSYDVIIVGAGPAGLSAGSELAAHLNVLVIDKKTALSGCTKSWFIPTFTAAGLEDVRPYLYNGVKRFFTHTFTGQHTCWDAELEGGYLYVKEHEILEYWGAKIRQQGSSVLLNCSYEDHAVSDYAVDVVTSQGTFQAKLLIDASGYNSLILKKYELPQDYYWWSIYGAIVEHPNGLHGMKVGDYMLWQTFADTNAHIDTSLRQGRPVYEYEILTENTSFPLILYLRKSLIDLDEMKEEFQHVLFHEDSTKLMHDVTIQEWKYGWYPSGSLSQRIAEDRVAFIGDAGCWSTPCGWGFGFILQNYTHYAAKLFDVIRSNRLDKRTLEDVIELRVHEKHQILFNQLASHFLSNASASQIDRFIKFFNSIEHVLCEKIFTLTITHEELIYALEKFLHHFNLIELLHIVPLEDYGLLLEEAKEFTESWIIDTVEATIDKLRHSKAKSNQQHGFDFS